MNIDIKKLAVFSDNRGWLTEVLKSGFPEAIDQVHFSVSQPGVARGNHYHKRRVEWMFVTNGTGRITLKDNNTEEKNEFTASGDCPVLIKILPNVTHTIINCGDSPLHLLILTSEKHDLKDSDTFYK